MVHSQRFGRKEDYRIKSNKCVSISSESSHTVRRDSSADQGRLSYSICTASLIAFFYSSIQSTSAEDLPSTSIFANSTSVSLTFSARNSSTATFLYDLIRAASVNFSCLSVLIYTAYVIGYPFNPLYPLPILIIYIYIYLYFILKNIIPSNFNLSATFRSLT